MISDEEDYSDEDVAESDEETDDQPETGILDLSFAPNEYKDNQFWYLDRQPNSDYGYIYNYFQRKFLTINYITNIEDTDEMPDPTIIRLQ